MNRDTGNQDYQRDFAAGFVASLGFDDALKACRSNGWDGVLGMLLADKPITSIRARR